MNIKKLKNNEYKDVEVELIKTDGRVQRDV